MRLVHRSLPTAWLCCCVLGLSSVKSLAQEEKPAAPAPPPAARRGGGPRGPQVVSPEVKDDRTVTFRIHAPKAEEVRLNTSDLPGGFAPRPLTKGENDVWEVTVGPVDAGAYRYTFDVDGVAVVDPRSK